MPEDVRSIRTFAGKNSSQSVCVDLVNGSVINIEFYSGASALNAAGKLAEAVNAAKEQSQSSAAVSAAQ